MTQPSDARAYAPATQRNREPILAVLQRILPPAGTILEISSGTGEHAVFFAPRLAPRPWVPSDPNPLARESIAAWQQTMPAENLHPPLAIDVTYLDWPLSLQESLHLLATLDLTQQPLHAIVNINMIHIAPWQACLGLMAGAGQILPHGGILYLYGPFKQAGQHTAPSNLAFDNSLRAQNPAWGVRDLEAVVAAAQEQGLVWVETVTMPANNFSVVFRANLGDR
ncbi:MAG: DUF938 domain-containing protein [Leptolyngbyaceae cyanobacterium SM2_5_2]|nr:DUF938 domain-containing protein [Leptolyngbyaceae cyanobacterium SM2_5_2]